MFYIYKITNKKTQKSYIGYTTRTLEIRWKEHCQSAFNPNHSDYNDIFKKSIRKYGIENWTLEIIEEVKEDIELLKQKEIYWIKELNTYAFDKDSNGYNSTRGGDGVVGYSEVSVSQFDIITGLKIQEFDSLTQATNAINCRIENLGKMNYSSGGYCWFYSKDIENLTKEELINKVHSLYPYLVYKLDLQGKQIQIYRNVIEASKDNNCSQGNITSCCLNNRNQAGGFQWCYQKDLINRLDKPVKVPNIYKIGVIQYSLSGEKIREYSSIVEASIKNNCSDSHISACCSGKRQIAGGFQWRYSSDNIEKINEVYTKRKVQCIETNEIFNTPNHAAKHFGYSQATVKKSCMGETIKKPYHFKWL